MSPAVDNGPKVLLVEDEESFVDALTLGLVREGFRVEVATDGIEALDRFDASPPDVVLLDVMLPRLSGIDVCRQLRSRSSVPILMLTAKTAEIDAVVGLEVGADDYITKPYRLRELVARIRAVLRRAPGAGVAGSHTGPGRSPAGAAAVGRDRAGEVTQRLEVGDVTLDFDRHEVTIRGEPHDLPLKEFELLALLLAHAGRVMPREVLIDRIWGQDYVGDGKTLDVHVKRLRAKVETDPGTPARIVTIRGVGYKYAQS